ncbi:hypothetical protein CPC735_039960 [Coccidioides posadasii C735 delta SOWgp]|uniref:Zinc finger GRF-type domain-containing protein n=1 Tax=Coccidioides posadasii (strain C735) TaxID=222929 RepID=C5P344_COCP7|nr:hypothetical protein CPC735_039960 [Coccidioides posadasii C735 delta SOWgp]EER28732.1 hypothetical protein CPC735_039960 [Coccidioides posadasii C735 delta SOWgp]|eukprot:XP_003070877.1 hypothetical protein CPC735_039960 [Coccidioides posadasii C735 delta SOWgp]
MALRLRPTPSSDRAGGEKKWKKSWAEVCAKPERKRCKFFIWDDEARRRSGRGLMTNSRTGTKNTMGRAPMTPSILRMRDAMQTGLLTPETTAQKRTRDGDDDVAALEKSPSKTQRVGTHKDNQLLTNWLKELERPKEMEERKLVQEEEEEDDDDFSFGWAEEMDQEATKLMESQERTGSTLKANMPKVQVNEPPETKGSNMERNITPPPLAPPSGALHHSVPSMRTNPLPPPTPTPAHFASTPLMRGYPLRSQHQQQQCKLISDTLGLLESHHISLPEKARNDLVNLLDTYDLRTLSITKGRDVSRMAIRTRDARIKELRGRIECLEAEREHRKGKVAGSLKPDERTK